MDEFEWIREIKGEVETIVPGSVFSLDDESHLGWTYRLSITEVKDDIVYYYLYENHTTGRRVKGCGHWEVEKLRESIIIGGWIYEG